jgi:hypothetical protein
MLGRNAQHTRRPLVAKNDDRPGKTVAEADAKQYIWRLKNPLECGILT